jgi:GNAT superfamily N-acetyltransferase
LYIDYKAKANEKETSAMNSNTENEFLLRQASIDDIPMLVSHHRRMFEEILKSRNEPFTISQLEAMAKAYTEKLQIQLANGICTAWVIEDKCRIIASGAVSVMTTVPVPADPSYHVAYLHSIYTDKDYRRKGLAHRITETAVDYCKSQGIRRMQLNASDAGRPVYETMGFRVADNAMRLWIR